MNRAVYLVVGLATGLLAGWLLFGSRAGTLPSAPAEPPAPAAATTSTPVPRDADRTDAGGSRIVFRPRTVEPPRPPPEPMEPTKEVLQLRERVAQLEKKLAADEAVVQAKQGIPVKAPEHLDARFDQERVRQAVNAALKEVGLDGEATAIDCSEYPCLAVGEIKSGRFGREESNRFNHAAAFDPYSKDSTQSFGNSTTQNGRARNLFGVAVFPSPTDAAEREQINKRLRYRFDEIQGIE